MRETSLLPVPQTVAVYPTAKNQTVLRSQLLQAELQLQEAFEKYPKSPSVERADTCFQLLDKLLPALGSYRPILTTIRDELYSAVYSKNLTSSEHEPFFDRIPYFVAVNRMGDIRKGEDNDSKAVIHDLEQKIKFRDRDLHVLAKRNLTLKEDILGIEKRNSGTIEKLSRMEAELQLKEQEKEEIKADEAVKLAQMRMQIETLRMNIEEANHMIEKLSVFKDKNTDDNRQMESTFKEQYRKKLKMDAESITEHEIMISDTYLRQLNEILNSQLDDHEFALAQLRRKREILRGMSAVTTSDIEMERDNEFRMESLELITAFKKRIQELKEEEKLLTQNRNALQRKLSHYKHDKKYIAVKRTADDALRIFAVALLLSKDGKNFEPFQGSPLCIKCGGKLIACPHRLLGGNYELPPNITHFRVEHPPLEFHAAAPRTAEDGKREGEEEEEEEEDLQGKLEATKEIARMDIELEKRRKLKAAKEASRLQEGGEEQYADENIAKSFARVWNEFKKRGGNKPALPRLMPVNKLRAFIQELWDTYWIIESECDLKQNYKELPSFNDYVYDFLMDRYKIPDVARKALYDYLSSMELISDNLAVALFVRMLSGEDDTSYKYIILARHLFDKYDPLDLRAYRHMLHVMYPRRPKGFYEQMELEQVAYSKNRFNREVVEERLMYILKRKTEPNYRLYLHNLKKYDFHSSGNLYCREFNQALTHLLPWASTEIKTDRYQFLESTGGYKQDQVPVEVLASTTAYFALWQLYQEEWPKVKFPAKAGTFGRARKQDKAAADEEFAVQPARDEELMFSMDSLYGDASGGQSDSAPQSARKGRAGLDAESVLHANVGVSSMQHAIATQEVVELEALKLQQQLADETSPDDEDDEKQTTEDSRRKRLEEATGRGRRKASEAQKG